MPSLVGSEMCIRDRSKVSRAAARLAAAGYVSKEGDAGDRRLVSLSLTPRGRALMDAIVPRALAFEAEMTADLTEDEAAAFARALSKLMARLRPPGP